MTAGQWGQATTLLLIGLALGAVAGRPAAERLARWQRARRARRAELALLREQMRRLARLERFVLEETGTTELGKAHELLAELRRTAGWPPIIGLLDDRPVRPMGAK